MLAWDQDGRFGACSEPASSPWDCSFRATGPATGPLAMWAAAHLMLHIPNAMILETVRAYYDGWYNEVVTERIPISDGMLSLPQSPGLGVALREEVLHWPDARVEKAEW